MDFIGPLPVCQGYTGLFVAVDKFSKLRCLIPYSFGWGDGGLTAPVVASLFFRPCRLPFRRSKVSLARPRRAFHVAFLARTLGFDRDKRHLFRPRTICKPTGKRRGQTKRVMQCVRAMIKEHKGTWVSVLPVVVELAINSTINDSTGYSPFYVAYGQEAMKPADLLEGLSPNPAAGNFDNRIATIYHVVRTRLEKAQASQKYQADKRRRDASFQVGDHVLLDARNLALPEIAQTGRPLCRTLQDYCEGQTYRVSCRATGKHGYPQRFPHRLVETLSTAVQQFPAATAAAHHCRKRTGVGDRSNQEPPDGSWQAIVFSIMGWSKQFQGPVDVGV